MCFLIKFCSIHSCLTHNPGRNIHVGSFPKWNSNKWLWPEYCVLGLSKHSNSNCIQSFSSPTLLILVWCPSIISLNTNLSSLQLWKLNRNKKNHNSPVCSRQHLMLSSCSWISQASNITYPVHSTPLFWLWPVNQRGRKVTTPTVEVLNPEDEETWEYLAYICHNAIII